MAPRPTGSTLFPYTTLFRSRRVGDHGQPQLGRVALERRPVGGGQVEQPGPGTARRQEPREGAVRDPERSEEHTSELQSRGHLVCRLLLEKKKTTINHRIHKL